MDDGAGGPREGLSLGLVVFWLWLGGMAGVFLHFRFPLEWVLTVLVILAVLGLFAWFRAMGEESLVAGFIFRHGIWPVAGYVLTALIWTMG